MPFQQLINYLNTHHAKYSIEVHSPAYTAQEVAERSHVHGMNMAKVVVLKIEGKLSLIVIPAHYHVTCEALADEIGVHSVEIASEKEFKSSFPDCELGAIPPFGELWHMDVCMSSDFHRDEDIAFNAGSWSELIRMPCLEFVKLANPVLVEQGAQVPGLSAKKVSQRRGRMAIHLH